MLYTQIIRAADIQTMEQNWLRQEPVRGLSGEIDFQPVVKLFNPVGGGTWLLTELEPGTAQAFGLADLGLGIAELGYIPLDELAEIRLRGGLHIEQDIHFRAKKTLSEYATEGRRLGYIKA